MSEACEEEQEEDPEEGVKDPTTPNGGVDGGDDDDDRPPYLPPKGAKPPPEPPPPYPPGTIWPCPFGAVVSMLGVTCVALMLSGSMWMPLFSIPLSVPIMDVGLLYFGWWGGLIFTAVVVSLWVIGNGYELLRVFRGPRQRRRRLKRRTPKRKSSTVSGTG